LTETPIAILTEAEAATGSTTVAAARTTERIIFMALSEGISRTPSKTAAKNTQHPKRSMLEQALSQRPAQETPDPIDTIRQAKFSPSFTKNPLLFPVRKPAIQHATIFQPAFHGRLLKSFRDRIN
jgi:ABC-type oligopeptide transport system ATPase subunit